MLLRTFLPRASCQTSAAGITRFVGNCLDGVEDLQKMVLVGSRKELKGSGRICIVGYLLPKSLEQMPTPGACHFFIQTLYNRSFLPLFRSRVHRLS